MLKRLLLILLGCFLLLALALPLQAGDDKDKTGIEEDNKYTDNRFGFSIKVPDDWKVGKAKKEPHCQRLVAEKKNPRIPPQLRDDPSWATPPSLMIYADSSDMTPAQFFAFLKSDTTESELKKQIMKNTVLLDFYGRYNPDVMLENPTTLAGLPAMQYKLRRQYEAQGVQIGRDRTTTIKDFVSGYIYIVQGDGWIGFIELVGENQFLPVLEDTFTQIIDSFSMPSTEAPQDSTATAEPSEG